MAKATPKRKQPFDIFGDERLEAAMQAATASGSSESAPSREAESEAKRTPKEERAAGQAAPAPAAASGQAPPAAQAAALPASTIEDHVPLKFEVPRSMRAEFQAFRAELGAALGGVALDNSNIGRALLASLLGPERARLLEAAREISGTLQRPRNDDAEAMSVFDAALRALFTHEAE
jgi:hypothetical protein